MLISRGNFHLIIQFYKAIDLGPTQILCSYKSLSKIHKVTSISYCYRATQVTFQMFSPGHEGECVRVLKVSHWIWSGLGECVRVLKVSINPRNENDSQFVLRSPKFHYKTYQPFLLRQFSYIFSSPSLFTILCSHLSSLHPDSLYFFPFFPLLL